jgi:hypothetical protein
MRKISGMKTLSQMQREWWQRYMTALARIEREKSKCAQSI